MALPNKKLECLMLEFRKKINNSQMLLRRKDNLESLIIKITTYNSNFPNLSFKFKDNINILMKFYPIYLSI